MSYYDSIDDDIVRAKEILAKGRTELDMGVAVPDYLQGQIVAIYAADSYAAYKLLESFVAEIERLSLENGALRRELRDIDAVLYQAIPVSTTRLGDSLAADVVAEIARLREALLALQEHMSAEKRCDFLEHQQLDLWRAGAEDSAKAVDELIRERDQLRAEVARLRAELTARDVDAEWTAGQGHDD